MNHYVYRVNRPSTGQFYIGIRSCKANPVEDLYMGSGIRVSRIPRAELTKTVLVQVQTRAEAARIERELVTTKLLENPLCLNLTTGGEFADPRFPSKTTRKKLSLAWTKERKQDSAARSRIRQARLEERRRLLRVEGARHLHHI